MDNINLKTCALASDDNSNTTIARLVFGHDINNQHFRFINPLVYRAAEIWFERTKGNDICVTNNATDNGWDDFAYIREGVYFLRGTDGQTAQDGKLGSLNGEFLIFTGKDSYFRISYESLIAVLNVMSPDDFVQKCVLPSKDPITKVPLR